MREPGSLSARSAVLWCYLIWYVTMAVLYFDPAPGLWLTSVGLSAVIGIALTLSVRAPGGGDRRWQVFRLFLIPFCVSSFSALVKDRGFIIIFSPRLAEDALAGGLCLVFLGGMAVARRVAGTRT